jgi:hypothetical protein
MPTREELIETQSRLQSLYAEVQEELMRLPGVVQVGIGMKEVGGLLTSEMVFRVYVQEKLPITVLQPELMIPAEIRGVKTDVIVFQLPNDEEDSDKYRPVKPGTQIGVDGSGGVGTLGCLAHLVADNTAMILSNHHVLYGAPAKDGTEVGQPEFTSSCCCTCNDIAINVHGIRRDHLDCAIARLKPNVAFDARIKEIGFITGIANAVAGEAVKKRGRSTSLTTGTISNIRFDATGAKILEIEVKKNSGNDRFSRPGDSGSALLNASNQIIGLHKEGKNGDDVTAGNFFSKSIGIQEVLDAFSSEGFAITLMTGSGLDESAAVGSFTPPVIGSAAANADQAFWLIEQRMKQSEVGRELYQVIERNLDEALNLVNHTRSVTVAWHRQQGPAFVAAIIRSTKEPLYQIPTEIERVNRHLALMSMAAVLAEHGSDALRKDIQCYSLPLIHLFSHYDKVDKMMNALEGEECLNVSKSSKVYTEFRN